MYARKEINTIETLSAKQQNASTLFSLEDVIMEFKEKAEGAELQLELANNFEDKNMNDIVFFTERKRCYEEVIELLSAKLQDENIEQCSSGDWIDFNDKLPKEGQRIIVSRNGKTLKELFEFSLPDEDCENNELVGFIDEYGGLYDGFAILKGNKDDMAWQPLPKPYRKK